MKIWTVTYNDDDGIRSEVFDTHQKAYAAEREWLLFYMEDFPHVDFSDTNQEIADQLFETTGFIDSITVEEHVLGLA